MNLNPNLTNISTARIERLSDYVQRIIDISNELRLPYGNLWYRGISDKKFDLAPGTVWRKISDEESLLEEFRVSLPAYSKNPNSDPWELYGLMQHHGLPTRLLDWSKSALASLFFALDFVEDATKEASVPAVWILDPYALNKYAHGKRELFVPKKDYSPNGFNWVVHTYLPECLRPDHGLSQNNSPAKPIAIEPTFSNGRLLAQQGCFTVHGTDTTPLNQIFEISNEMFMIEIEPAKTVDIRSELEQLGFRAEWLYQDLDRLSQRIIRERS